jgi:hypothetical protein
MKNQRIMRMYNFSDADLVVKGKEKISFMQREIKLLLVYLIFTDFKCIIRKICVNLFNLWLFFKLGVSHEWSYNSKTNPTGF